MSGAGFDGTSGESGRRPGRPGRESRGRGRGRRWHAMGPQEQEYYV